MKSFPIRCVGWLFMCLAAGLIAVDISVFVHPDAGMTIKGVERTAAIAAKHGILFFLLVPTLTFGAVLAFASESTLRKIPWRRPYGR